MPNVWIDRHGRELQAQIRRHIVHPREPAAPRAPGSSLDDPQPTGEFAPWQSVETCVHGRESCRMGTYTEWCCRLPSASEPT